MTIILLFFLIGWLYLKLTKFKPSNILGCGLVGFSGTAPVDPAKLNMLLYFSKSRGIHSTGIYSNGTTVKSTEAADDFIVKNNDYKEAICGSTLVIGHTRFATVGAVTAENAHPFTSGRGRGTIYGTHNGWLIDTMLEDLADEYDITMPNVDSKLIFDILTKTKDLKVLKDLPGAMALAFIKNKKLHLYRRTSRPLFYGYTKEGTYYSSLHYPLQVIGCSGIGFLAKDQVFIIEDGSVVDKVEIGQPKYIPSLAADASPYGWRQALPYEETKDIPIRSKSERNREVSSKKSNGDGKMTVSWKRSAGGAPGLGGISKSQQAAYRSQQDFIHSVTNKVEIEAEYNSLEYVDLEDTGGFGLLLLRLINNKTQEPVYNMPVFIAEYPEAATKTNELGFAAIKIDMVAMEEGIRVMTLDPSTERAFYSKIITLKRKRVVEVALNVPFRSQEEAKAINESGVDWRGVLRGSDRVSEVCFDPTLVQRRQVRALIDEAGGGAGQVSSNRHSDTKQPAKNADNSVRSISEFDTNHTILIDNEIWKEEGYVSYEDYVYMHRATFGLDPDPNFTEDRKLESSLRNTNPVKADMIKKRIDDKTLAYLCAYKPDSAEYENGIIYKGLLDTIDNKVHQLGTLNKQLADAMDIGADDADKTQAMVSCLSFITALAYDLDKARYTISESEHLMPF